MSALEQLVMEHGTVQVQYVPHNEDMPWTVTLQRSRWLGEDEARALAPLPPRADGSEHRVEWWDHEHAASVEEAAAALLKILK